MSNTVTFTAQQGNYFLRMAHGTRFPAQLREDQKFASNVRATFDHQIRQLYRKLKAVSPICSEEHLLAFGPREWWRARASTISPERREEFERATGEELSKARYVLTDEGKRNTCNVSLTGDAKRGLFRLLVLSVHPESPHCMPPGAQDELAWPLAEQIGAVHELREITGLNREETIEIKWDNEYESDKKAESVDGGSVAG